MINDHPKSIKRQIRDLKAQAHENELARELTKLEQKFADWHAGKICAGDLSQMVHEYHNGPARELYVHYNSGYDDLLVASALVTGILSEADVPQEVRLCLEPLMELCRRGIDD